MLAGESTLIALSDIQFSPSRRTLCCALILTLGIAAVYANSWRGVWVFDDQQSIGDNPTIRHLCALGTVLSPPGEGATVQGRPILNLSFAVNYALGGLNPLGYHAVNLAIHLASCLALFGLVRGTVKSDGIAFAVAFLWALHPLQTESVTYIVQRAESLASLFYLLTLYCFVRAMAEEPLVERGLRARLLQPLSGPQSDYAQRARRSRSTWFTLSAVCCLLGMGTKEIVVSAPVVVYAYDAIFLSGGWAEPWRRRRGYYLALAATWLPLGYLVMTTHGRGNTVGFSLARPAWQYWLTQFPAVAHYLRLSLWPAPLIFDRGYDLRWIDHPADIVPYAVAIVLLLARTGYELVRRTPAGWLGLAFFAVLAPTSLVPGYLQTMAEHRMYLPLAAVLAGVVTVVATEPKLRRWRRSAAGGRGGRMGRSDLPAQPRLSQRVRAVVRHGRQGAHES